MFKFACFCVTFWIGVNILPVFDCSPVKKQLDYNQDDPLLYANNMDTYYESNYLSLDDKPRVMNNSQCGTRGGRFQLRRTSKIIGGMPVIYGEHPWQVQIQHFNFESATFVHHCGGAVVGERLILSAAHCLQVNWRELCMKSCLQLALISRCPIQSICEWSLESITSWNEIYTNTASKWMTF